MRKIICRFDNQQDLDKLNWNLNTTILEYDLDNNKIIKSKQKSGKKKPYIDKHDCDIHYVNMPEFQSKKIEAFHKIVFHTDKDLKDLSEIFDQNISDKTKSIWFPKLIMGKYSKYRVIKGDLEHKYPIYIVSKQRSDNCYTSNFLSQMEVNHFVVVEPDDYGDYKKTVSNDYCEVLKLNMKYKDEYDTFDDLGDTKSKGPGAARNFCWDDSIERGFTHHWVMDDNTTEGFHWLYQNVKIKCRSGSFFRVIEDFVDRYDNLAISGLNYSKFCKEIDKVPPFVLNTRIYSFLLIRNDIPYRWRGRYNEDTDLSLRCLKDNWCTVQFNSFLAGKATTQKVSGGNTKEFYDKEGTLNKSKMLEDMHPDVAKVVWKFNRWHHQVDYSKFPTRLKLKDGVSLDGLNKINNCGMEIIKTEETTTDDKKEYLEKKYSNILGSVNPKLNSYS
jgi:TET-Associated Glycosyltransferase